MHKLVVTNAFNNTKIAEFKLIDEQEAKLKLNTARKLFDDRENWLADFERIEILENVIKLITERQDELALTASQEGGKPLFDSKIEISRAIIGIKSAIAHMHHLNGKQIPTKISPSAQNHIAYTYREPLGVVLAISAFNHPFNLIVHQVIPAIATGCAVLIKPASKTPISCHNLVEILYQAGLPKTWCQILMCSNQVAEKLVSSADINFLSFIGSHQVGWHLKKLLANNTQCTLEHGGVAPVIICDDADISKVVPAISKGGFYHAGQVCVSVQRVYIHSKIIDKLVDLLKISVENLIVGDPANIKTEVGPLITKNEIIRINKWVQEAINKGAKLITGGKILANNCYSPTILLNPSQDAIISQQEVFGPVICLYTFDDLAQVIQQANALTYCFQAAIFSESIDKSMFAMRKLKANAVMINDHTAFRLDWMPFGGRELSGFNLGGIPYSMQDLTHEKLFVINSASLKN